MSRISNKEFIRAEARLLASSMFGLSEVSELVIARYIQANNLLLSERDLYLSKVLSIDYEMFLMYVVQNSLDLCAIEYYVRLKDKSNIITKKTRVISYLLETECKSSGKFRAFFSTSFHQAILSLALIGLMALLKMIKGWMLTRWVMHQYQKV